MEYLMGACTKDGLYGLCNFCKSLPFPQDISINKSPRSYPDYTSLPTFKYLPLESTAMANRSVDDFLPRANLKKLFNDEDISSSDQISVKEFSIKFIVEETYVVAYLSHLELLGLKKRKHAEHRLEKNGKPWYYI